MNRKTKKSKRFHLFAQFCSTRLEAPGLPVIHESQVTCFLGLGKNFLTLFQNLNLDLDRYCIAIENFTTTPRFELGRTLEESFRRVYVAHKNCYDYCLKRKGATCPHVAALASSKPNRHLRWSPLP